MRFYNLTVIHKTEQIICELSDCKRPIASRCFTVPSGIDGIYVIVFDKSSQLIVEIVAAAAVSVEENQRLSLTAFQVEVCYVHKNSDLISTRS